MAAEVIPTETYLLNLTKKQNLSQIKSLCLKNLNLTSINGALFSKMTSVTSLDLSSNDLQEIPRDFRLPNLVKLDLTDNQLSSAEFVAQFPRLKELFVEGNSLESSDKYIAYSLCPSLESIDKMKTDSIMRMVQNMRNRLKPQVAAVWEGHFMPQYAKGIKDSEIGQVKEEFLKVLKISKLASPTNFRKYSDFMIGLLGEEVIEEVSSGSFQLSKRNRERVDYKTMNSMTLQRQNENKTPVESSSASLSPEVSPRRQSPRKRPATPAKGGSTPSKISKSPRESSSPRKKATTPAKSSSPRKKPTTPGKFTSPTKKLASPPGGKSGSARKGVSPSDPLRAKLDNVFTAVKSQKVYSLPQLPDYDPAHFVRCHFGGSEDHGDNDPTDDATQVWKCEFEPDPCKPGCTTNVVATCGGHNVCLLDCNTGKVLKRLKHESHTFYSLAWTTVTMNREGRKWSTNLLAAAGVKGHVKLLHPEQMVCYAEFQVKSHNVKYINWMLFHPDSPTILFCGDSDGYISVFDIGLPEGSNYVANVKSLAKLKCGSGGVTSMIWSKQTGHLLAGTEEGCYVWNANMSRISKLPRTPEKELVFCHSKEKHVDGLCLISDDLAAVKVLNQGCIWLWRLSATLHSRASVIRVSPVAVLDYTKTTSYYMSISCMADVLLSGDDKGGIHMYDVSSFVKSSSAYAEWPLKKSRSLPWPKCIVSGKRQHEEVMIDLLEICDPLIVNSVAISHDKNYVVGTTDNNMVCIWKKSS